MLFFICVMCVPFIYHRKDTQITGMKHANYDDDDDYDDDDEEEEWGCTLLY